MAKHGCFGRIWESGKTTIQAADGVFRLAIFAATVLPLSIVLFSFATLESDFDSFFNYTNSTYEEMDSFGNITNSTEGVDFSGFVSLAFGTFSRIIQSVAAVLLMGETIVTTQKPFGLQVQRHHGFLDALRMPWGYVVASLMLIVSTINSVSYNTFLQETKLDKAIEKTSAALTGHRYPQSCSTGALFPTEDAVISIPAEGTSAFLVLEMFFFSKVFLLVLGGMGIIFSIIDRIRSPDKIPPHNELDNRSWRSRRWYETADVDDPLSKTQSKRTRCRRALMLLWPVFSIGLQVYFLTTRFKQNGIDAIGDRDSDDWFYDGSYYVTHTAQLLIGLMLAGNIVYTMTRTSVGIVHTATVLTAMFLLFLSVADFGALVKQELGDEFGDDLTATAVAACALVLLLLPMVAQIVLPSPDGLSEGCLDPVVRHMLPDALDFLKKILTPSIRWYRAAHCLGIASGVASLMLMFLCMGSPIISMEFDIGPDFANLKDGVDNIVTEIEKLQASLSVHVENLNPCVSAPKPITATFTEFLKLDPYEKTNGVIEYTAQANSKAQQPGVMKQLIENCDDGIYTDIDKADCDELLAARNDPGVTLAFDNALASQGKRTKSREGKCVVEYFPETGVDPDLEVDQVCEDVMCGLFLGSMIALTIASAIPFAGAAAVAAKVAARIAQTVVKFGKRLYKVYKTVGKYKMKVVKALKVLKRVASGAGKSAIFPSNGLLWAFVPVFVVGLFCILVGFWKRKQLKHALYTAGVSLAFGTLAVINTGLFLSSFFVVSAVNDTLKGVPEALVRFNVYEESGMRFLQAALACGAFSAAYWALATASEATVRMLKLVFTCGRYGRRKHVDGGQHGNDNHGSSNSGVATGSGSGLGSGSGSGIHSKRSVGGWLLAVLILVPGLLMVRTAYNLKQRAVVLGAWNNDDANNVMDALQAAGVMGKSTAIMDEDTSSLGCGPVGLAVQAIGKAVFDAIKSGLPTFNLAFAAMRKVAEQFVKAVSNLKIDNPFSAIDFTFDWSQAEFAALFAIPLLGCAMIIVGCLVALFLPHYTRVLDFIRTNIFSVAVVGLQFVLAIVGITSVLDGIIVPFFELRVEWGQGATSAIVMCFLLIISSFSLNVNILLPVGDNTDNDEEEEMQTTNPSFKTQVSSI